MPLDPDRLAAAVVEVLTKTLAPIVARLGALEHRAATLEGQAAEIGTLREAAAAADRHVLGDVAALRAECTEALAALRQTLEALKTAADPATEDPPPPVVRH